MNKRVSTTKTNILNFLKIISAKITGKYTIVVFMPVGLGDYLYFRNFAKLIKEKYKNAALFVITNKRWCQFALKYNFSNFIDGFFHISSLIPP